MILAESNEKYDTAVTQLDAISAMVDGPDVANAGLMLGYEDKLKSHGKDHLEYSVLYVYEGLHARLLVLKYYKKKAKK